MLPQVAPVVKNLPANAGNIRDGGSIPGSGRSLEEGMATHSSILAWRIPIDRETWGATIHGVTQRRTGQKRLSMHTHTQGSIAGLNTLWVNGGVLFFLFIYKKGKGNLTIGVPKGK